MISGGASLRSAHMTLPVRLVRIPKRSSLARTLVCSPRLQNPVYNLVIVFSGVLRSLAPAISNSLFSLSIDKGCLGGYMVYFVFVSAVMALCAPSLLPEAELYQIRRKMGR
jgi:hypothetical protein